MKKTITDRIRMARLASGYSQDFLAAKIGVQRSAVAQWELANGCRPTIENLVKVAKLTYVRLEWLATGRGQRTQMTSEKHSLDQEVETMYVAGTDQEMRTLAAMRKLTAHECMAITELAESLTLKRKRKPRK